MAADFLRPEARLAIAVGARPAIVAARQPPGHVAAPPRGYRFHTLRDWVPTPVGWTAEPVVPKPDPVGGEHRPPDNQVTAQTWQGPWERRRQRRICQQLRSYDRSERTPTSIPPRSARAWGWDAHV